MYHHVQPRQEAQNFFDETLTGWAARMRSAGCTTRYIQQELRYVERFVEAAGAFPWACGADDVDRYGADLARMHKASTVRQYQRALATYLGYLIDPAYDWSERCQQRFGMRPRQLCIPENTHKHVGTFDASPDRRALTPSELDRLFATLRDALDRAESSKRKGYYTIARDFAFLATVVGFGLRAREAARLELFDLSAATDTWAKAAYGPFGSDKIAAFK